MSAELEIIYENI
jgi:dynein heavy chain